MSYRKQNQLDKHKKSRRDERVNYHETLKQQSSILQITKISGVAKARKLEWLGIQFEGWMREKDTSPEKIKTQSYTETGGRKLSQPNFVAELSETLLKWLIPDEVEPRGWRKSGALHAIGYLK